jgi:hypothetical protein
MRPSRAFIWADVETRPELIGANAHVDEGDRIAMAVTNSAVSIVGYIWKIMKMRCNAREI